MTPQNLRDYVKVYENHLPADLCKSASENLDKINWQEHTFYQAGTDSHISYDHELSISHDTIPEKAEINRLVWFAIERYILRDFGDFQDWFSGWNSRKKRSG